MRAPIGTELSPRKRATRREARSCRGIAAMASFSRFVASSFVLFSSSVAAGNLKHLNVSYDKLHSSVPVPNGGICSLSLFLESTRRFPNSSRVAQPLCFKTLHVFISHLKVD